jgi:hypothetical protein
MNRLLYRSLIALSALAAAILAALPVWDHWYYNSRFVGTALATSRPVAPATAGNNAGAPTESGPLPSQLLKAAIADQNQPGAPAPRGAEGRAPIARPGSPTPVPSAGPGAARAVAPREPAPSARPLEAPRPAPASAPGATVVPEKTAASQRPASPPPAAPGKAQTGSRRGSVPAPSTPDFLVAMVPPATNTVSSAPPSPNATATPSGSSGGGAPPPSEASETPQPAADAPPHVALLPGTGVVAAGDSLVVKVALIGGRDISGVPFHLSFNPEVLQFVSAREGSTFRSSSLAPILLAGVSPERPGDLAVGLSLIGSGGLLNASGEILELEFRGLKPGTSNMQFDRASLRGPHGETL